MIQLPWIVTTSKTKWYKHPPKNKKLSLFSWLQTYQVWQTIIHFVSFYYYCIKVYIWNDRSGCKTFSTVGMYVATMLEKVFLGSDDSFCNDFLQGIHLCKKFCNPTMAFWGQVQIACSHPSPFCQRWRFEFTGLRSVPMREQIEMSEGLKIWGSK